MTTSKKRRPTSKPTSKPAERRRVNGFLVYEEGEKCVGCGAVQHAEKPASGMPSSVEQVAGYYLECSSCGKPGCEECMPLGRGCACPDCEADRE